MPEKLKKEPEVETEKPNAPARDLWSDDQRDRQYYYDDAYGYETYEPDRTDDEDPDEGDDSKKADLPNKARQHCL